MKMKIIALAIACNLPVIAYQVFSPEADAKRVQSQAVSSMSADKIQEDEVAPSTPIIKQEDAVIEGLWQDVGVPYNCKQHSPLADTVNLGREFEQSSICTLNRERTLTKSNETSIETGAYERMVVQVAKGTKNYKVDEKHGEWSEPKLVGEPYDCMQYEPGIEKVGDHHSINRFKEQDALEFISREGTQFVMSKSCKQATVKHRYSYDVMADGSLVETAKREVFETEQVPVHVTKDATEGVYSEEDTFVSVRVERSDGGGRNYYELRLVIAGEEILSINKWAFTSDDVLLDLKARGYGVGDFVYRVDNDYFPTSSSTYKLPVKFNKES